MQKLYVKIVVAIWVVMIVTSIAVMAAVRLASSNLDPNTAFRAQIEEVLRVFVERIQIDAAGKGEQAFIERMRDDPMLSRVMDLILLDAEGNVLLSLGAGRSGQAESSPSSTFGFEHDGRPYEIVASPRRPPGLSPPRGAQRMFALFLFRPEYRWLLLLIAVPLTALLSLVVARYLVSPLRSFERAGRRLADGDFSVRVAPSLGNRGDEIAEFAMTFDQMAIKIEALVNSHKDLLRDVSHELRSPLARTQAAVSLARQRTRCEIDDELDRIEHEIERLNAMIGKLLTFSRLDAGKAIVRADPVDVGDLLGEIVNRTSIEAMAEDKRIELHADARCETVGDTELLASALENVIRNALRHTPRGSAVEIAVARLTADERCRIHVRDHGSGVPESVLERIFDPFFRTDAAREHTSGGSGIGLAIAKKAVTAHGGTLQARNAGGGGLEVSLELPLTVST